MRNATVRRIEEELHAYMVEGELGRGSWGVVYAGQHRNLDRAVAIKVLPQAFAVDPTVRERFVREARLAASFNHPHIVPVYDFIHLPDGTSILVMQRCERSIDDLIREGPIEPKQALAMAAAALLGLDYAHKQGVLHRDVKPDNLLVDSSGTIMLADFGIARHAADQVRLTATGTVVGTPAYMSPEQASAEPMGVSSDVYSMGVVAYEMLSGRLPFDSASIGALIKAHLIETPPPLDQFGQGLADVLACSLAKAPTDRFASSMEFARSLVAAANDEFGPDWLTESGVTINAEPGVLPVALPRAEVTAFEMRSTIVGTDRRADSYPVFVFGNGQTQQLIGDRFSIGRGGHCDIVLNDANVSREHALLVRTDDGQWLLRDLDSTNGTFVNGEEISEAYLPPNADLTFGEESTRFLSSHEISLSPALPEE